MVRRILVSNLFGHRRLLPLRRENSGEVFFDGSKGVGLAVSTLERESGRLQPAHLANDLEAAGLFPKIQDLHFNWRGPQVAVALAPQEFVETRALILRAGNHLPSFSLPGRRRDHEEGQTNS